MAENEETRIKLAVDVTQTHMVPQSKQWEKDYRVIGIFNVRIESLGLCLNGVRLAHYTETKKLAAFAPPATLYHGQYGCFIAHDTLLEKAIRKAIFAAYKAAHAAMLDTFASLESAR